MDAREHTQGNLQLLREKLDSGRMRSARLMVHSLHPGEIARLQGISQVAVRKRLKKAMGLLATALEVR